MKNKKIFSYETPRNYYCPHCKLQINNVAVISKTGKKFLCYLCNTKVAYRKFKSRKRKIIILPGNFENNKWNTRQTAGSQIDRPV